MPFTSVTLLNAVSPKSGQSKRVARGLVYGPHPRQRLDLYAPIAASAPLPVVVFVYGGAWTEGDRGDYAFAGRYLAAQGYLCVVPDYRLLPADPYPAFIADTAAATHWALAQVAEHGGDPTRVALVGHSAGAYNAVMAVLDRQYGLGGRLRALAGLSGPYDFYPFNDPISRRTFGDVASPERTQPVHLVHAGVPPMFLATGERDRLVWPRNTIALAAALRRIGVPVEERHYPRAGHAELLLALGSLLPGPRALRDDLGGFLAARLRAEQPADLVVEAC